MNTNRIFIDGLKIENFKNDDKIVHIEGVACTFGDANLNNEIVDEKSFEKFFELYNQNKIKPKLNWEHRDDILVGGIDEIISDKTGLYITAHLLKDIAFVRDTLLPLIENKDINSFSTEGLLSYNDIYEREDGTYYCKNFLLTGVSIVANPACTEAKFTLKNFINQYITDKKAEQEKIEEENQVKSKYYLFV